MFAKSISIALLFTCAYAFEVDVVSESFYVEDVAEEIERVSEPTCQLTGEWYNEYGSELILVQHRNGTLTGEFRTAVESECGAAGDSHAVITGQKHGNMFMFHTFYPVSETMVTWSGQCHENCRLGCVGTPRRSTRHTTSLHTTYIMTSETDTCQEKFNANSIGTNVFQPRPMHSAHTPLKSNGIDNPVRANCGTA